LFEWHFFALRALLAFPSNVSFGDFVPIEQARRVGRRGAATSQKLTVVQLDVTERIHEQSNRLWAAKCRLIAAGLKGRHGTFFPTRCWQAVVYQPEEKKVMKTVIGSALLVAFIGVAPPPASAQTSDYYVVQDVKTKKCTIVDKKPTTTTEYSILSDGTVFKSRTEAESGMKTYKVCTSN
jgi:hypothetical protein